jgi:hypothetical protein
MQTRLIDSLDAQRSSQKLILVLEQQTEVGERIVHLIRQGTPFQAILASSLLQAHTILLHLKCDVFLLTDDTLPEEDMERLYLLPAGVHPPALLNLTWFSWARNFFQGVDMHRMIDTVNRLLSAYGG